MVIIKEKRPDLVCFTRNADGTYSVTYSGCASIDDKNTIRQSEIKIERCTISWDDSGFIPQLKIKEILRKNDENNEFVDIIYTE